MSQKIFWKFQNSPKILEMLELCISGYFCKMLRRSSLAQTIKAFIGRLICSFFSSFTGSLKQKNVLRLLLWTDFYLKMRGSPIAGSLWWFKWFRRGINGFNEWPIKFGIRGKPGKCAPKGLDGIDGGVFCETKPDEFGDEVMTGAESFEDWGESARFSAAESGDLGMTTSVSKVSR